MKCLLKKRDKMEGHKQQNTSSGIESIKAHCTFAPPPPPPLLNKFPHSRKNKRLIMKTFKQGTNPTTDIFLKPIKVISRINTIKDTSLKIHKC